MARSQCVLRSRSNTCPDYGLMMYVTGLTCRSKSESDSSRHADIVGLSGESVVLCWEQLIGESAEEKRDIWISQ